MTELAGISETTVAGQFVVLTNVGRIIHVCHCPHIGWRFDGAELLRWGVGVFLNERLVIGRALICTVRRIRGGGLWASSYGP